MEVDKDYIYSDVRLDVHEGKAVERLINASRTPFPDPDGWLDEQLKFNVLTTTVDAVLGWARRSSMWPVISFPACCAFEVIATASPRFDFSRFGMEIIRASPRQADLMITAGTLTWKMAPQIKRLYEQMAEPKWVIAMGSCGITGGLFRGSYAVVPGYNRIVPVDVYVPGCPPRPEGLLQGIQMLHKKVQKAGARGSSGK